MHDLLDFDGSVEVTREWRPIHLSHINVLAQPRKKFSDKALNSLKENIFSPIGLLYSPIVALYRPEVAQQHLAYINELWGTGYKLTNQKKWGRLYPFLLAGERRLRAAKKGDADMMTVQLWRGLTPFLALHIQFSENIQIPLEPEEEAIAHDQFYRLYQKEGKDISVPRYADWVGRSPSMIRRALKYGKLPLEVQGLVSDGVIPYSIALHLKRLQDIGIEPERLKAIGIRASLLELTAEEFKKGYVNRKVEERLNGQTKMFPDQDNLDKQNRKEAGQQYSRKVWQNQEYFDLLFKLIDKDLMGTPEKPLSSGGPSRKLAKEIDTMSRILNKFAEEWYSKEKREELARKAAQMQKALATNDTEATYGEPQG